MACAQTTQNDQDIQCVNHMRQAELVIFCCIHTHTHTHTHTHAHRLTLQCPTSSTRPSIPPALSASAERPVRMTGQPWPSTYACLNSLRVSLDASTRGIATVCPHPAAAAAPSLSVFLSVPVSLCLSVLVCVSLSRSVRLVARAAEDGDTAALCSMLALRRSTACKNSLAERERQRETHTEREREREE